MASRGVPSLLPDTSSADTHNQTSNAAIGDAVSNLTLSTDVVQDSVPSTMPVSFSAPSVQSRDFTPAVQVTDESLPAFGHSLPLTTNPSSRECPAPASRSEPASLSFSNPEGSAVIVPQQESGLMQHRVITEQQRQFDKIGDQRAMLTQQLGYDSLQLSSLSGYSTGVDLDNEKAFHNKLSSFQTSSSSYQTGSCDDKHTFNPKDGGASSCGSDDIRRGSGDCSGCSMLASGSLNAGSVGSGGDGGFGEDEIEIPECDYPFNLSEPQYDAVIIYTEEDQDVANFFADILKTCIMLQDKRPPTVCTLESGLHHHSNRFNHLGDALERSTYMFMLVTKKFCSDSWAEVQRDECLMESIDNPEKRWCVIPILTQTRTDSDSLQLPFGLRALKGVNISHILNGKPLEEIRRSANSNRIDRRCIDSHFLRNMTRMLDSRLNLKLQREKKQKEDLATWLNQERFKRWKQRKNKALEQEAERRELELKKQKYLEEHELQRQQLEQNILTKLNETPMMPQQQYPGFPGHGFPQVYPVHYPPGYPGGPGYPPTAFSAQPPVPGHIYAPYSYPYLYPYHPPAAPEPTPAKNVFNFNGPVYNPQVGDHNVMHNPAVSLPAPTNSDNNLSARNNISPASSELQFDLQQRSMDSADVSYEVCVEPRQPQQHQQQQQQQQQQQTIGSLSASQSGPAQSLSVSAASTAPNATTALHAETRTETYVLLTPVSSVSETSAVEKTVTAVKETQSRMVVGTVGDVTDAGNPVSPQLLAVVSTSVPAFDVSLKDLVLPPMVTAPATSKIPPVAIIGPISRSIASLGEEHETDPKQLINNEDDTRPKCVVAHQTGATVAMPTASATTSANAEEDTDIKQVFSRDDSLSVTASAEKSSVFDNRCKPQGAVCGPPTAAISPVTRGMQAPVTAETLSKTFQSQSSHSEELPTSQSAQFYVGLEQSNVSDPSLTQSSGPHVSPAIFIQSSDSTVSYTSQNSDEAVELRSDVDPASIGHSYSSQNFPQASTRPDESLSSIRMPSFHSVPSIRDPTPSLSNPPSPASGASTARPQPRDKSPCIVS